MSEMPKNSGLPNTSPMSVTNNSLKSTLSSKESAGPEFAERLVLSSRRENIVQRAVQEVSKIRSENALVRDQILVSTDLIEKSFEENIDGNRCKRNDSSSALNNGKDI